MLTGGLSRWRKGALAPFGEPEGFQANYAANVSLIVMAISGSDMGKGLFRRHNGQLLPTSPPTMPIATPIRALAEDRKDSCGLERGLTVSIVTMAMHFTTTSSATSPRNAVSSILADKHGGLWVGTYTGLFYFPLGEPDPLHRSQLIESQLVTCMIEDSDGSVLSAQAQGSIVFAMEL